MLSAKLHLTDNRQSDSTDILNVICLCLPVCLSVGWSLTLRRTDARTDRYDAWR